MQLLPYLLGYSGKLLIDCMRNCSHQVLLLSSLAYNDQVISLKNVDMKGSSPISMILKYKGCSRSSNNFFFFYLF